jgi:competence protein ComEC
MEGEARLIADWPGADCNPDFCAITLQRGGRAWQLLIGRGKDMVEERALAAACERADVVIAPRYLPRSCRPRWLKADRRMLDRTGGIALDLQSARVRTVAEDEGRHGWWQPATRAYAPQRNSPAREEAPQPSGAAPLSPQ